MKYKNLTKEQILISLDRLTRFKPTKEKYLRVFFDIILGNLIEPKFKKVELEQVDVSEIRDYAVEIINSSLAKILDAGECDNSSSINSKLKNYENSVFKNDKQTQILLDNKIDYMNAIKLIDENCVVNLRWLKSLAENADLKQMRHEHYLKFPIEKVLLVEGLTEETLLPAFSKFLGFDFYQEGMQVIPAGGKSQVVKMYYRLSEELKLPIFLLLDKDAEENIAQIRPKLRSIDKIHLVSCGEFEDLLPKLLIIKTVNKHLENFNSISDEDFDENLSNAKNLELIFKTKGLHEFKKAEFSKLVRVNISDTSDVSDEIRDIIKEISNKTLDSKFCSW